MLLTNKGRKGGEKRVSKKQYEKIGVFSTLLVSTLQLTLLIKMQKLSAWLKKKKTQDIYSSLKILFK